MSKIVIGIHGLGNKPPAGLLGKWWKRSLREGFERLKNPAHFFRFEIVFWADILYRNQLDPNIKDKTHPLCITEPYIPSPIITQHKPSKIKKKILDMIEKQLDNLFLNSDNSVNLSKISDYIIHNYFQDLEIYYSASCVLKKKTDCMGREIIRERLIKILRKHKRKKILLIAHSMGTIITYDVLSRLPKNINIDTLITIGSPLGIPLMMKKIAIEQRLILNKQTRLHTPDNIRKAWYNFSDLNDKVAFNYNLGDDYDANSFGIKPRDIIVFNDYKADGKLNPHKSFGYLRTNELSEVVYEFLTSDVNKVTIWFNRQAAKILDKIF